jgi:hypothetical protein
MTPEILATFFLRSHTMTTTSTTKPVRWVECDVNIHIYGWIGVAKKPAHADMDQTWRYDIIEPGGEKYRTDLVGCELTHDTSKGIHPDDKRKAQLDMLEHINEDRPLYAGA